jgi:hypothetical protein
MTAARRTHQLGSFVAVQPDLASRAQPGQRSGCGSIVRRARARSRAARSSWRPASAARRWPGGTKPAPGSGEPNLSTELGARPFLETTPAPAEATPDGIPRLVAVLRGICMTAVPASERALPDERNGLERSRPARTHQPETPLEHAIADDPHGLRE